MVAWVPQSPEAVLAAAVERKQVFPRASPFSAQAVPLAAWIDSFSVPLAGSRDARRGGRDCCDQTTAKPQSGREGKGTARSWQEKRVDR